MTRAQKAAAILVAMGKPSASRLLKFFKQDELKALIEGARLLRTIRQAISRRSSPSSRPSSPKAPDCSIRRPDGHDPQRVAVARRDERADGRRAAEGGAGRTAAGLAGDREARSGSARHVPAGGASADRGTRAVEAVAVGRRERAADARKGCAERNRQAHDVDGGHTGGRDKHHREPVARRGCSPKARPRTRPPARSASPACSTNWTRTSSTR